MKRAVKYCGGCNPRYDRVGLVKKLEEKIGVILTSPQPDCIYDELYVVCGCSACCADISLYKAKKVVFICNSNLPLI